MTTPAGQRNKDPILEVLKRHLPGLGLVVEVASGTGQHVAHFASQLTPTLEWLPTDMTDEEFGSIAAHTAALGNVLQPVVCDASWPPEKWPLSAGQQASAMLAINLTHICEC